jgi:hypothetical protein
MYLYLLLVHRVLQLELEVKLKKSNQHLLVKQSPHKRKKSNYHRHLLIKGTLQTNHRQQRVRNNHS